MCISCELKALSFHCFLIPAKCTVQSWKLTAMNTAYHSYTAPLQTDSYVMVCVVLHYKRMVGKLKNNQPFYQMVCTNGKISE